MPNLSNYRF